MKNETIQVDGKFYNRSKVVMLPTEKATQISSHKYGSPLEFWKDIPHAENILFQHLYFLSEEVTENNVGIKTDEWVIKKWGTTFELIKFNGTSNTCYKIIATTDESLKTTIVRHNDFDSEYSLPRPSNEFLQAYCKANGKIDEVLIECEANFTPDVDTSKVCGRDNWRLKVSPDNTVTIKKLERKLYLTQQEIDKRINMHDELIGFIRKWLEEMDGELKYGGEHNVPWNRYNEAKELIKQHEAK